MNGKEYFKTDAGHGMFLKEGAGRIEIMAKVDAKTTALPPELQEHILFLFKMFDTDNSGGIDPSEAARPLSRPPH